MKKVFYSRLIKGLKKINKVEKWYAMYLLYLGIISSELFDYAVLFLYTPKSFQWCGTQAVREQSAKLLFAGSIPART